LLVIFRLALSIVRVTGIIYSPLNHIKNKALGFDKNQKLIFNFYTDDTQQKMDEFANDLINWPK
jgi:putative ABC transport system permease protein